MSSTLARLTKAVTYLSTCKSRFSAWLKAWNPKGSTTTDSFKTWTTWSLTVVYKTLYRKSDSQTSVEPNKFTRLESAASKSPIMVLQNKIGVLKINTRALKFFNRATKIEHLSSSTSKTFLKRLDRGWRWSNRTGTSLKPNRPRAISQQLVMKCVHQFRRSPKCLNKH